jgi:flavin-binding protein dodecin
MDEHSVHLLEVSGFSTTTLADAVRNALMRAAQNLSPLEVQWVEKGETREIIDQGRVVGWQVTLKIGWSRSWAGGFAHRSIARDRLIHMHLFESPIYFHPCGYPIYLDRRWNGKGWEAVFVDARQDSPTEGEEIKACPTCQRVISLEDLQRSERRYARDW